MDITLQQTVFYVVAILMSVFSVMTVTTGSILRSATYLLFVLFGTAAIYFILGYTFLGAVQLMVYAGGIVVLYVFSILLTNSDKSINHKLGRRAGQQRCAGCRESTRRNGAGLRHSDGAGVARRLLRGL